MSIVRTTPKSDLLQALAERSVRLIRDLQEPGGAYPASPTFSAYKGYSWFRDGSFIADAMSCAGEAESAERFFDWCAAVLDQRREHIGHIVAEAHAGHAVAPSEMLPARFTFDGADGADEWWDFQLDGYGTWLWALCAHLERFPQDASRWASAVTLTVDYLTSSWQRPCYDWWEEHSHHVHVSTLGAIAAGLDAVRARGLVADERAEECRIASEGIRRLVREEGIAEDGFVAKWIGSTAVDGSLSSVIAPFGILDGRSELGQRTLDALERHLTVDGGTHRYLGDTFFGGGQWPLLSCFLGLAQLSAGNAGRARELLHWAASTANDELEMPEQLGQHLIAPGMRDEWLERWGPVATPLLWSHAMFLRLGIALGDIDPASLRDDNR